MSTLNIYTTAKLPDKKVIDLLTAIKKQFGNATSSISMGTVSIDYNAVSQSDLFKSKASMAITKADIHTDNYKFHIRFRRGTTKNSNDVENSRESSPHFDEVVVVMGTRNPNDSKRQAPAPEEIVSCDQLIQKYISNVVPTNVEGSAKGATELLQAQMANLSSQYQEMISGLDQRRAKLDADHDAKMVMLDEMHNEKLREIDAKRIEEEERIKQKTEALDAREQDLDNRNHMHVRRGLREKINEEIRQRLQKTLVPPSASVMRLSVFALSILAAFILGYISFLSLTEFANLGTSTLRGTKDLDIKTDDLLNNEHVAALIAASGWFLIAKTILSSLGAVASFVYAVRWLRQLYLDDVQAERELERYAYDINRASWAIETIMEMQTTKGAIPPQTWIEAICNNLFVFKKDQKLHEEIGPLEAMLNASAKVSFGSDGARFELNQKGAKKLADHVSNDRAA
jgi:hypothetical protein